MGFMGLGLMEMEGGLVCGKEVAGFGFGGERGCWMEILWLVCSDLGKSTLFFLFFFGSKLVVLNLD